MSTLARFKILNTWYKARIFERASRKRDCACCGQRKFGVLIRHIDPVKKDTLICEECIVKLSLGRRIDVIGKPNVMFGLYPRKQHVVGKKRGPKVGVGRKLGTKLTRKKRDTFKKKLKATLAKKKEAEEKFQKEQAAIQTKEEPECQSSDYPLTQRSIYGQEQPGSKSKKPDEVLPEAHNRG